MKSSELTESLRMLTMYQLFFIPLDRIEYIFPMSPHDVSISTQKYTGLYGDGPSKSFPDALKLLNYVDANGRKYEVLGGRDEMMIQCLVTGITVCAVLYVYCVRKSLFNVIVCVCF